MISAVSTSPADALLRDAITTALRMPPAERADFLAERLAAIEDSMARRPKERPWTCTRYTGTDGSRIFRGGIGHSLVVDPHGGLWRARSYEDFETTYDIRENQCTIATLTPLYAEMRPYTLE